MPNENEPLVIIQPKAYLKMLKHVLRFGSMAKKKSQFKECMGMLFGKLGDQKGTVRDVIVTDVAEFTHGGHIEVAFEDKDYVALAEINDSFASQGDGVFNVGWYHSHPGLSVFLSTVDVRNHLGFQTTNPSAIAIVWDHILLEDKNEEGKQDIGFETFRLTELGKGQYSDYKAVKTIVETPTDVSFYKDAIKSILDMQHGGNPPMFEVSELPNVIGDYDPTPIDDAKYSPPEVTLPTNRIGANIGSASITPELMDGIKEFTQVWANDLAQGLKNKGVVFNQNLTKLKNTLESKVKGLQEWFMNRANEVFLDVWEQVDTPLETQIEEYKPNVAAIREKLPLSEEEAKLMELSIPELLSKLGGAN